MCINTCQNETNVLQPKNLIELYSIVLLIVKLHYQRIGSDLIVRTFLTFHRRPIQGANKIFFPQLNF